MKRRLEQQIDTLTEHINDSIRALYGTICPLHGVPFVSPGPGCYIECSECRRLSEEPYPESPSKERL